MKQLSLGNESIAFQDGAFFKDLTLIIQDFQNSDDRSDAAADKYLARIDRCIYDSTGILTASRLLESYDNAAILVPSLTKGNVLYGPSFSK